MRRNDREGEWEYLQTSSETSSPEDKEEEHCASFCVLRLQGKDSETEIVSRNESQ